ncbi:MAG: hypothetical protein WCI73_06940 [Phycisphaerae bacterium]
MAIANSTTVDPVATASVTLNYHTSPAYVPAGAWAQGNLVFVRDRTTFPPRCVGCNGEENLKMKVRTLSWTPPYYYLVLLLGLLPGALILLLSQEKATVTFATCRHCRRKAVKNTLIMLAIVAAAFGSFIAAGTIHASFSFLGLALLLAAIIYGVVGGRLFVVKHIKDKIVTLKGVNKDFVATLDHQ